MRYDFNMSNNSQIMSQIGPFRMLMGGPTSTNSQINRFRFSTKIGIPRLQEDQP